MPSVKLGLEWFSRNLIEILPAAVYVCRRDGVVVAFNKRAAELWGRAPFPGQTDEKFCGSHRLFRSDGTFMPHHETPMEEVLRTGEASHNQEAVIERPDGSRISVLVNIAPILDDTGMQVGAVNCFQDLTSQKRSEAERLALGEKLRQSQKMEAVGQLTGGLAHDFNNLLTGISGNLEMLQTRIGQGRVADLDRYIAAAQSASRRAAALTHRLLAFSRRQTLDVSIVNSNTVVAGMVDLVRRTVGPEITVTEVVEAGLWNALIDPNQFENALLNLCINARDAMPGGGVLTIETANRTLDEQAGRELDLPAGEYVWLGVGDTGVGMTAETVARAFEPFFTTKPIGFGTGLGLSMIHGFARQSGGQAHIVSQPGHGSTVSLYLPRTLQSETAAELTPGAPAMTYVSQGATILVVDDELMVRTLVIEMLEGMGHIVIGASDAESGLRVVVSGAPLDLMITDVGLPGRMDGRQLAEAARAHRPELKVLFITGYTADAVLDRARLAAGMHVMTKPFTLDVLARRINDLLAYAAFDTATHDAVLVS